MTRRLLIPLLVTAAVAIPATAVAASLTHSSTAHASKAEASKAEASTTHSAKAHTSTSENWAGYVITPNKADDFSAVSGDWTQPAAKCSAGQTGSYAAFWVGLGGGEQQSEALEQIGTQADCATNGDVSYYAWYELVPSAPVKLSLTVHAGDKLSARVAIKGEDVTLELSDHSSGRSWSKTLKMSDPAPDGSTAEWVAEAPSECADGAESACTPLPLTDFGTAKFSDAHATAGGHTGSIDDSDWTVTRMSLAPSASSILGGGRGGYFRGYSDYSALGSSSEGAAPSSLSSGGTAFSVKSSTSTASSGSGSGQTEPQGYGNYGDPGGYGGYGGYGGGSAYGYGGGGSDYGYGGYGGGYGGYGYGGGGSYGYGSFGY